MMKRLVRLHKQSQGFTLVELMIVVAIIGILAAIAIPQFAAYRQRAFNASAESDVRNCKTSEEVLQADNQTYGGSEMGTVLPGTGSGLGGVIDGPLVSASTTQIGGLLTAKNIDLTPVGVGIGVGNQVFLKANTEAATTYGSFVVVARHNMGPRSYGTDSDTTAIYYIDDPGMIGSGAINVVAPTAKINNDDFGPSGNVTATVLSSKPILSKWTAQ